jgi:hypothetical protein
MRLDPALHEDQVGEATRAKGNTKVPIVKTARGLLSIANIPRNEDNPDPRNAYSLTG